ncbi:MAG: TatD family hydrolase, partial [Chloroflexota bacterium]
MLIDTHCHLDFDRYNEDRNDVVQRALDAGVERIIIPAVDLGKIEGVLKIADQFKEVFAAVGIHPNSTAALPDNWLYEVEDLADHPKVLAIGEIGLDYYWDASPKAV